MPIKFLDGRITLWRGDCLKMLRKIDADSIDSVVTDPPYHLTSIVKRFGNKSSKPVKSNMEQPGGAAPYKRLTKGFMGKQWDGGDIAFQPETWAEVLRVLKPGGHLLAFSGTRTYHRMAVAIEDAGFEIRDQIGWCYGSGFPKGQDMSKQIDKKLGLADQRGYVETTGGLHGGTGNTVGKFKGRQLSSKPVSDEAKQWYGWNTSLKPAWEPLVLARKPISESSVVSNVMKWGTGALNVEDCIIETEELQGRVVPPSDGRSGVYEGNVDGSLRRGYVYDPKGRWPANVIHDGSDEVVSYFPDNAARFFYSAKAGSEDRLALKHPTVKPIDLMQYLVRLITPKGGTVLDPFAGTGTTGEAAWHEGLNAVLIEREKEYQADIKTRMSCVKMGSVRRKALGKEHSDDDFNKTWGL